MRSEFPEFYSPTEDQLRAIYETGTIALDANVLLALYEVRPDHRDQILDVLWAVENRLFVPHQAVLEYQRQRLKVIDKQAQRYRRIDDELTGALGRIDKILSESRRDRDLGHEVRKPIEKAIAKARKALDRGARKQGLTVEQALTEDPIRDALDELLDGRVGQRTTDVVREERIATGVLRAKERRPPGYLDAKTKHTDEGVAGDYLIWQELLDHASGSDRPLLLITDDTKEDWFERVSGRTNGPRRELVIEMSSVSAHPYHQQTLGRFLDHIDDYIDVTVTDEAVEDVVALSDHVALRRTTWAELIGADQPRPDLISAEMNSKLAAGFLTALGTLGETVSADPELGAMLAQWSKAQEHGTTMPTLGPEQRAPSEDPDPD